MGALQNLRHAKFCELVTSGIQPAEAYIAAGFSSRGADQGASRLLRREDIQDQVSALQARVQQSTVERSAIDRLYVVEKLKLVVQRCLQEVPVTDSKGRPTGAFAFNPAGAVRALELLGKELGMFKSVTETTLKWDGDISKLTNDQMANMQKQLAEIAFKDDPAGLEEWRSSEAGTKIQ
jgi:hypothetical protein